MGSRSQDFKVFLEEYSLYRKCQTVVTKSDQHFDNFFFVPLHLYCTKCKMKTTHGYDESSSDVMVRDLKTLQGGYTYNVRSVIDHTFKFTYECNHCTNQQYCFLIRFDLDTMFKAGQYPSPDIVISPEIENKLGKVLAGHYRKGKISETHGHGIAAMAYYRRVIEDKVIDILKEIKEILPGDKIAQYTAEIDKILTVQNFEAKAEVIYALMPDSLKPGGQNLIKLLFSAISEGLHSKTDEECLELAVHTSRLLELIIETLNSQQKSAKEIEALGKLLQKKDK
jgi:hypothetical protein